MCELVIELDPVMHRQSLQLQGVIFLEIFGRIVFIEALLNSVRGFCWSCNLAFTIFDWIVLSFL